MVLIHKITGRILGLGSKVMLMCGYCHLVADLFNTGGLFFSREKFVQKIYKDNRAGAWTVGYKVTLIGRVHGLQQVDLVFSKRGWWA